MIYSSKCWNCNRSITKLEIFCEVCNAIQQPTNWNPFDLFQLNYDIEIDEKDLDEKLLELQTKVHPDKFFNSSEKEKSYSIKVSSEVNNAYDTLKNNVKRINFLLKLFKFKFDNEKQSFDDKTILGEIMELQNKCLMCDSDNDKEIISKEISEEVDNTLLEIKKNFSLKNLEKVHKFNVKLSYLEKLNDKLKKI
tara:strand:+ start:1678 stop:2259 length:582 start_codon:yes stop_codon:yes gene_type:complete